MNKYKVIGLMSGTSLDGLDVAYCEFVCKEMKKRKKWDYKIVSAKTIKYNHTWRQKLSSAMELSTKKRELLDTEFGRFIASKTLKFIRQRKIKPDFISSHGHTVFHQPEKKITLQIGDGNIISSLCKLPVVCDFRSGDVALGGQGAPLVPVVDKILFSNYFFCLNLGGFANISFDAKGRRIAFDICPVNIVLNALSEKLGLKYDNAGKIAEGGRIDNELLLRLNKLSFYKKQAPKSLGREWVEKEFIAKLNGAVVSVEDKLRTVVEHIAVQISNIVNLYSTSPKQALFITGGGAYNSFLIRRIKKKVKCKMVLPDDTTIQFKEAMAFAFLGVLRMRGEINILKSVTGAKADSSGGVLFIYNEKKQRIKRPSLR